LQYIIFDFIHSTILLFLLSSYSWNSFNRFHFDLQLTFQCYESRMNSVESIILTFPGLRLYVWHSVMTMGVAMSQSSYSAPWLRRNI
jgi:hypothetical protein